MKYALITGGSSGLGEQFALQLGAMGYNVIVAGNQAAENVRVAESVASRYGVVAHPLYADLACEEAAEELYHRASALGEIDILISNAGFLLFGQLINTPVESLRRIVALHCTTPAQLCRLVGADMARRGRGHILIVSSITAWTPYPTISHYAATKNFLRSLGDSLWYEMRSKGVSVTTLFPSAVDTPLYDLDATLRRRLLRFGVMMRADVVARRALKAMFRSRRRCFPNLLTKLEAAVCYLLPAQALLPIMRLPVVKRILDRC